MILETTIAQVQDPRESRAQRNYVLAQNFVLRMTGFPAEMSSDPGVQPLLPLRLKDDVVVKGNEAVFLSSEDSFPLSVSERAFLRVYERAACDALEGPVTQGLVERKILVRNVQVPIHPRPLEALQRQVASWPEHPAKERWSSRLQTIEDRRRVMEQASGLAARQAAIQAISQSLTEIGLDGRHESQVLYASRLPINEDYQLGVKKAVLGQPDARPFTEDIKSYA